MKNTILTSFLIVIFITANSQSRNTYLTIGTSISNRISEKASFGGILKKTNFGVILETQKAIPPQQRRTWLLGVELGQSLPLSPTIDALASLEGKVDLNRKNIYAGPQFGLGFTIIPQIQFLSTFGVLFSDKTKFRLDESKSDVNLGIRVRF